MALQSSGQLSLSDIAGELSITGQKSLSSMSATAGFSAPHSIVEFYGYSNVTISDIGVYRYGNSQGGIVTVDYTSFPQTFQSSYIIIQEFGVAYYNYTYNYPFTRYFTYYFNFNNTNLNSTQFYRYPTYPSAYIQFSFPTSNPTLVNNGLPVNLIGWN